MATEKKPNEKKEEEFSLIKIAGELTTFLEKLSERVFLSSVIGLTILVITAGIFIPKSTELILTELVKLAGNIGGKAINGVTWVAERIPGFLRRVDQYIRRNGAMWLTIIFAYIILTILFIMLGYSFENNWLFGAGTILLIAPIIALGYIQKKIGNIFKEKSPNNSWIKNGNDKITIAVLIGLFALEFMLLHTIWFIIATVLFMAVAFTGAFFFKKSPQPLESLKKLAYLYTGVTFLFIFIALMAEHNATAKSVMERVASFNYLKIVERNDQTEIINNIAKETEKSPWRLTSIDTEMRYGAFDGIDVEKEYKVRTVIPANSAVQIIKDYTFTDKFGKVWVHVKYGSKDGWAQNRWLEKNLTNDEVVQLLKKNN